MSLLYEKPEARGLGVDLSPEALAVVRRVSQEANLGLVEALQSADVRARVRLDTMGRHVVLVGENRLQVVDTTPFLASPAAAASRKRRTAVFRLEDTALLR